MTTRAVLFDFGGVFTEAWSFEKPVIGGRIPPIAEVIDDGVDGLLSSRDSEELADRILWLLTHADEAHRMGRAGREKVERRFSWERLGENTERIYESVLSDRATASSILPTR